MPLDLLKISRNWCRWCLGLFAVMLLSFVGTYALERSGTAGIKRVFLPSVQGIHTRKLHAKNKATMITELDPIEAAVLQHIQNTNCVRRGDHLLLSISGGVDSMAMLHVMSKLSKLAFIPDVKLSVISFNHNFRSESTDEVEFVRNISNSYSIPFYTATLNNDVGWTSSIQSKARQWRHSCYVDWVSSSRTDRVRIATGHHSDDQLETILAKLLRGAHISNLNGISPIRNISCFDSRQQNKWELTFIRPLLTITKQQIIAYMKRNNFDWREDSSNADSSHYRRNAIRQKLIPAMKAIVNDENDVGLLQKRLLALSEQSQLLRDFQSEEVTKYSQQLVRWNHFIRLKRKNGIKMSFVSSIDSVGNDGGARLTKTRVADIDCASLKAMPMLLRTALVKNTYEKLFNVNEDTDIISGNSKEPDQMEEEEGEGEDSVEDVGGLRSDRATCSRFLSYSHVKAILDLATDDSATNPTSSNIKKNKNSNSSSSNSKSRKTFSVNHDIRASRIGNTLRLEADQEYVPRDSLPAFPLTESQKYIVPTPEFQVLVTRVTVSAEGETSVSPTVDDKQIDSNYCRVNLVGFPRSNKLRIRYAAAGDQYNSAMSVNEYLRKYKIQPSDRDYTAVIESICSATGKATILDCVCLRREVLTSKSNNNAAIASVNISSSREGDSYGRDNSATLRNRELLYPCNGSPLERVNIELVFKLSN